MDMQKTGLLIAKQRKKLGYTQKELGDRLNVSGKAVSKWERGISAPDIALLERIAIELKLGIEQLLDGEVINRALSSSLLRAPSSGSSFPLQECEHVTPVKTSGSRVVSPYLFGSNLEHTRSCIYRGLSAQMLKNRKFVGKPSAMEGVAQCWYVIGAQTLCEFSDPYTHHDEEHYHMHRKNECNAQTFSDPIGETGGIGQHELYIKKDETYVFAFVVKVAADIDVTIALTSRWGKTVYAQKTLPVCKSDSWERYETELVPDDTDDDADLRITVCAIGTVTVGAVSLMNKHNFRGMRPDVIEAMKTLGIRVLRWPGGNFAGEYNWFDGLLPVDERAPLESYLNLETQPHSLGYDFHEIDTDDFIALCRQIGAEPFLTINLTWNTPEENAAWVEYCNGDETTPYGKKRAARGNPEPYNVRFWSLGNEFGYGHMEGDNSASGYSHLARENGLMMLKKTPTLSFCSSGANPSREWAEYSAKPLKDIAGIVSLHFYALARPSRGYAMQNGAPSDSEALYHDCMASVPAARDSLYQMRALLGTDDIQISFDEWNVWNAWFRPSCVLDGLFTALMMHMIIREAPKCGIAFACHFEAVNESAIRVRPEGVTVSATGQALSAMSVHAGGVLLYASDCAVATKKDGVTTLTLINPRYDQSKTFSFDAGMNAPEATLFEGKTLLPPSRFTPSPLKIEKAGSLCETVLPPHSFAVIRI